MALPHDYWKSFERRITSFQDFIDILDKINKIQNRHSAIFAWRGQANAAWGMHSSLSRKIRIAKGRFPKENELSTHENHILAELHQWGLHNHHLLGRLSVLNQLAILQHFGAPTRLIDITFNAWVALWFATELLGEPENDNADGRIFCIDISKKIINENSELRAWEDDLRTPWKNFDKIDWSSHVYAWKPANIDSRISSQNGAFLLGGIPTSQKRDAAGTVKPQQFSKTTDPKDKSWLIQEVIDSTSIAIRPHSFENIRSTSNGLCFTFVIASNLKAEIRERLEKQFGYSHKVIYPDYTGFSRYAAKIK